MGQKMSVTITLTMEGVNVIQSCNVWGFINQLKSTRMSCDSREEVF